MKVQMKLTVILLFLLCEKATARSWKDIVTYHKVSASNTYEMERIERDPYHYHGNAPASSPTNPSVICDNCGNYATSAPALDSYPENEEPLDPPKGYFNYNVHYLAKYGPGYPAYKMVGNTWSLQYKNNYWAQVQRPDTNYYWDEFGNNGFGAWKGILGAHNMDQSVCGSGTNQSPIDIRKSGVACVETHQIRVRPGDFRIEGDKIQKKIEANKLRFIFPRRPCLDLTNEQCKEPDPPFADFPNGWRGDSDAMHVDFKIPAEHQIYGEEFDAEMQIFHIHPDRGLIPAISILMKVEKNGHNSIMQEAIDVFQHEFDMDQAQCGRRLQEGRKVVSDFHSTIMSTEDENENEYYQSWGDYSTRLDDPEFVKEGEEAQRKLSEKWHPYHPDLMRTIYFYGYDGSLTEPPCTEIVSWFVMDEPMIIDQNQLNQMKNILFNHVDENCARTSTHYHKRGVARPLQDTNGRMVWHCNRNHFLPDNFNW